MNNKVEELVDIRDVVFNPEMSERERYAEYSRQLNNNPHDFLCDGFTIHETFDPDGPEFSECVVRIFK